MIPAGARRNVAGRGRRPASRARGAFHLWEGGAVFVGGGYRTVAHERFPASLCLALDRPFRGRFGEGCAWGEWRGVLVAPNALQEADMRGTRVAILIVDPESEAYHRIAHLLSAGGSPHHIADDVAAGLIDVAREMTRRGRFEAARFWDLCLEAVGGKHAARPAIDRRVARVLELLKHATPEPPPLPRLAAAVGLSESRLSCLFNASLGLSIRRYAQWLRVRHAVFCMALGNTITAAAHEAGFADLAHLSRTFRAMFGLPISTFFGSTSAVDWVIRPTGDGPLGPHALQDRARWIEVAGALGAGPLRETLVPRRASRRGHWRRQP